MGFDVWPINSVQFSNHTGYGKWQGEICSEEHILNLVNGIFEIQRADECKAILTGYMGSGNICNAVSTIVKKFKKISSDIIYLCDPVIGGNNCYVKPEVLDFFKTNLYADIITPNKYEAEVLSGITINAIADLYNIALYFHNLGIKIVIITGIKFAHSPELNIFASDGRNSYLINDIREHCAKEEINGTGDLFSSTFLGSYLKYNDVTVALQYATLCVKLAIEATISSGNQELQVLSVGYRDIDPSLFTKLKPL
jgi:pyridoxine kinase